MIEYFLSQNRKQTAKTCSIQVFRLSLFHELLLILQIFFFSVSDSLFSSAGYTFGAPTPPPGSPYSPVQVTQLELLAKGFTNSNIIIQQPDYPPSPKKPQIQESKRCDEKCCSLKPHKPCGCQQVRIMSSKYRVVYSPNSQPVIRLIMLL